MVLVVRLVQCPKPGWWKDPLPIQFGCADIVNISMMILVPMLSRFRTNPNWPGAGSSPNPPIISL